MILESSRQADAQNLGPTLPKDFADLLKPAWTMESMMGFLVVSSYPNDWQPDQLEGVPLYEQRKFFKLWGSKFKVVDQDGPRMNHVFRPKSQGYHFFLNTGGVCRVPSSGVKIQKGWYRMTNSGWLLEHSWTSFSEKGTWINHAWLIFFQEGRNLCLSNWLSKHILNNWFHRYSGASNWVATG